jgi:hypothetical protein
MPSGAAAVPPPTSRPRSCWNCPIPSARYLQYTLITLITLTLAAGPAAAAAAAAAAPAVSAPPAAAPAVPALPAAAAAAAAAAARPARPSIRDVLLPPPLPSSLAYLAALEPGNTDRKKLLKRDLTPAVLASTTTWADTLTQHLTAAGIKLLTMWATHREWRLPKPGEEHHTAAPLLQCLPYPQRSHYLYLEDSRAASLRARLRARRALTEEHRQRLEGDPSVSAACTFPVCAQQQPPPTDSVPHILSDCPRHAARRAQLTTDYRALARNPAAQLSLPFILGCAFPAAYLSKAAAARFAALRHLTASFLRDVDDERQRDGLRPFEPP